MSNYLTDDDNPPASRMEGKDDESREEGLTPPSIASVAMTVAPATGDDDASSGVEAGLDVNVEIETMPSTSSESEGDDLPHLAAAVPSTEDLSSEWTSSPTSSDDVDDDNNDSNDDIGTIVADDDDDNDEEAIATDNDEHDEDDQIDPIDNSALLSRIAIGSRIEVYWPADKRYHSCVVVDRDSMAFILRYDSDDDDDMVEHIDLIWERFRLCEDVDDGRLRLHAGSGVGDGDHSWDVGAGVVLDHVPMAPPPPIPISIPHSPRRSSLLTPIAEERRGDDDDDDDDDDYDDDDQGDQDGIVERTDLTWESRPETGPAVVSGNDDETDGLLNIFPALTSSASEASANDDIETGDSDSLAAEETKDEFDSTTEPIDNEALLAEVTVGSRLEVYWPADGIYRACVVMDHDSAGAIHTLRYEDGLMERIDLTWENFRLRGENDGTEQAAGALVSPAADQVEDTEERGAGLGAQPIDDDDDDEDASPVSRAAGTEEVEPPDDDENSGPPHMLASPRVDLSRPYAMTRAASDSGETIDNEALLSSVTVGSCLEVYWPADGNYHACAVINRDSFGAIHTLRYDDGIVETIDLTWEIFRRISNHRGERTQQVVDEIAATPAGDIEEGGAGAGTRPSNVVNGLDEEDNSEGSNVSSPKGAAAIERVTPPSSTRDNNPDSTVELNDALVTIQVRTPRMDAPVWSDDVGEQLVNNDNERELTLAPAEDTEEGSGVTGTLPSDVDDRREGEDNDNDGGNAVALDAEIEPLDDGIAGPLPEPPAISESTRARGVVARAGSDSAEMIDNTALLSVVTVGSRLEVYWPADDKYHPCVVAHHNPMGTIHTLRYEEDGVVETIDLTWENFRLHDEEDNAQLAVGAITSPGVAQAEEGGAGPRRTGIKPPDDGIAGPLPEPPATSSSPRSEDAMEQKESDSVEMIDNAALLSAVTVGSRLEVYWPADDKYHPCVVAYRNPMRMIHTLRYEEDGVVETIDLTWENFRLRDEEGSAQMAVGAITGPDVAHAEEGGVETDTRPSDVDADNNDDSNSALASQPEGTETGSTPTGIEPPDDADAGPPSETSATSSSPRAGDTILGTESDSVMIDNTALLLTVTVGSRLEVYWPADGKYHTCVVSDRDSIRMIHTLRYDDGVEETIDLTWEIFRVSLDDRGDGIHQAVSEIAASSACDIEEGAAAGDTGPSDFLDGRDDDNINGGGIVPGVSAEGNINDNSDSQVELEDTPGTTLHQAVGAIAAASAGDIEGGGVQGGTGPSDVVDGRDKHDNNEGGNAPGVLAEDSSNGNSDSQVELENTSGTTPGVDTSERLKVASDHVVVDIHAPDELDGVSEQLVPDDSEGRSLPPPGDNIHVPQVFQIDEGVSGDNGTEPFWQQKRTKILIDIFVIITVVIVVILAATLSNRSNSKSAEMVAAPSDQPSSSVNPTRSPTTAIW